jgi:serine/threonine protein kinase
MKNSELNLVVDCFEAVYHEVEGKSTNVPVDALKQVVGIKTKPGDFEIVKTIAKGGYGEVFLVKREKIYAMKRVPKDLVLKQPSTALFMAEKEAMVDCIGSEWLVYAHLTMQDKDFLYYIMDFLPGGDFLGLLTKHGLFEEEWVRFYAAELVMALDELHRLGWIHRDLKPDNILIDADGHIKLADFGSCIRMAGGKARSSITVGTPDYVSPDVLSSINVECEYGEDVDFWTLGVIIYEMVFDATPFYSPTLMDTYQKITKAEYEFPFKIGAELHDLIRKLIAKKEDRIGIREIKAHPFFKEVDWGRIREMVPPFIPQVADALDTSNFIDTQFDPEKRSPGEKRYNMDFVGFTFDPGFTEKLRELSGLPETQASVPVVEEKSLDDLVDSTDLSQEVLEDQKRSLEQAKQELEDTREQLRGSERDVARHREELKEILIQLISEKEELEEVQAELERCKQQLKAATEEVSGKTALSSEGDAQYAIEFTGSNVSMAGEKKDIGGELVPFLSRVKGEVAEMVSAVLFLQEAMGRLSVENSQLSMEVRAQKERYCQMLGMKAEAESQNKLLSEKIKAEGIDSLRRQLKLRSDEARECQQRLDQEIAMRKQIQEELEYLRKERTRSKKVFAKQSFTCTLLDVGERVVKIEEGHFWMGGESYGINSIYIAELKNNELHHLSIKKRALTLKMVILNEEVKSVSSTGRRSLKSLEEDLKVELAIKEGIENIRQLLTGPTLEEANMQLEGSAKKIKQLRDEIDRARKSTLNEDIPDDPVKMYEFNNHLYVSRTLPQGTLCDFCNEVLYGLVDQGFECRDCKMVVHKPCYILGDVSCELYAAMKRGKTCYVTMRTIEDRDKLLRVSKGF